MSELVKGWNFHMRHGDGVVQYTKDHGSQILTEIPLEEGKTILVETNNSQATIYREDADGVSVLAHTTPDRKFGRNTFHNGEVNVGTISGEDIGLALANALKPHSILPMPRSNHSSVDPKLIDYIADPKR